MCQLIEKIASDKGINLDDANIIFIFISSHLLSKIPALSQVIEDVFENVDESILQEHISKAIQSIQERQWKEKFKDFHLAPQTNTSHQSFSAGELF